MRLLSTVKIHDSMRCNNRPVKRRPNPMLHNLFLIRWKRSVVLAVLLAVILGLMLSLFLIASQAGDASSKELGTSTQFYFYPIGLILFALTGLATVTCLSHKLRTKPLRITFWRQLPEALGITAAVFLVVSASIASFNITDIGVIVFFWVYAGVGPLVVFYLFTSLLVAAALFGARKIYLKRYSKPDNARRKGRRGAEDKELSTRKLAPDPHPISLATFFIIGTIPGVLIYMVLMLPILNRVDELNIHTFL